MTRCQCEYPLIKCDSRGCRCHVCGLPERLFQPSFGIKLRVIKVKVPVWVKTNGGMIRRRSLEPDHPESVANWIRANLGIEPEEWMLENAKRT